MDDNDDAMKWFVGILLVGGIFVFGFAVGRAVYSKSGAKAFDVLPDCKGLVVHNEDRGLEAAREVGRTALNAELAAMELFGGCGLAAVQSPEFAPNGRFVYLAIRAVASELVKRELMTVSQAATLLTDSLAKLDANGVDVAGLPGGLE